MTWDAIFILSVSLSVGYFVFCLTLIIGSMRLPKGASPDFPFVSVIVAARNEEEHIRQCITALVNQNYPVDKFEIIIVDDRSEDKTAAVVEQCTVSSPPVHLIRIQQTPRCISPKKYALQQGIEHSKGEIILTTDADCAPGPAWIKTMRLYFSPGTGFVAGFSPLRTLKKINALLNACSVIDAVGLAVLSAGSIGLHWGTTCTGRNLAYRKKVYDEVQGFLTIGSYVSGDDDLMLHTVRKKTTWRIAYALHPDAAVPAAPVSHCKDFFHQRIRHASKFSAYPRDIRILGIGVYVYNALLILTIAGFFISGRFLLLPLYSLALKLIADFAVCLAGKWILKTPLPVAYIPLVSFIHPLYVVIFGALGMLKKFQWKGKTFRAEIQS